MKVGRNRPDLDPALADANSGIWRKPQQGYAHWRFPVGPAKKAALGNGCTGRVCSGQNQSRKECRSLSRNGNRGGDTRPLQSLAVWRCRYTSLSATIFRPRAVTVGATFDPRYGCSVNTVESGSRLARLHCTSVVALSGGEAMSNRPATGGNQPMSQGD